MAPPIVQGGTDRNAIWNLGNGLHCDARRQLICTLMSSYMGSSGLGRGEGIIFAGGIIFVCGGIIFVGGGESIDAGWE